MKISTLLLALTSSVAIEAHTIFTTLWVNGVSQGDGVGIRMRKDPETASFPISLSDNAMACGYDGEEGNPRVISVNDGATLSFEWRAWGSDPSKGAIDPGHRGPCAVYLKKVDSAVNDTGVGDGWFKIWDEGYDESTDQWCNQKLGGADSYGVYQHMLSVNLPSGLEGGYYLARPEILALHAALSTPPDPQFYTGCAQLFLKSSGTKKPKDTVSIPGAVKSSDSSVTFNVYADTLDLPYDTPGPAVADLVSDSDAASNEQSTQGEGLEPAGCIMEMAGWCGYEVSSYSNETGCYASGQECWDQDKECWDYADTLPTSGDPWCTLWGEKCQAIDDQCDAGNYDGPPNKGKAITPSNPTTSVVMAASTSNYESVSAASATSASSKKVSSTTQVNDEAESTASASPTTLATSYVLATSSAGTAETKAVTTSTTTEKAESSTSTSSKSSITSAPSYSSHHNHAGVNVHTVFETVVETKWEYYTAYVPQKRHSKHGAAHAVQ